MPTDTQAVKSRPELARDLGVSHAGAIVVGTIIGSGIFLVPAEMMQAVGSAKLVYLAWLVGGLLSFFGALTYAELGAMKPQAGGEYVYVRDGYGPLAGFLYAWTWFIIAKPASIATVTIGLVRILGTFPVFAFFSESWSSVSPSPFPTDNWLPSPPTVLISLLNYLGIKKAGEFQLVFTLLKVAIILGIVRHRIQLSRREAGATLPALMRAPRVGSPDSWPRWWPPCGLMTDGTISTWSPGEIRQPERNIPIALIAGVATVGALYMLVNAAVQFVLPADAIAASAAARVGRHRLGVGHPWRQRGFGGDGGFHAGHVEWHHHERGARPFRGGARPLFFLGVGRSSSTLPHAFGCHRGASGSRHSVAASGGKLPAILFAGDFRGVAVLHDRREHGVHLPATRSAGRAALSGLGISRWSRPCLCCLPRCFSTTPSPTTCGIPRWDASSFWRAFRFSMPLRGGEESRASSFRVSQLWDGVYCLVLGYPPPPYCLQNLENK